MLHTRLTTEQERYEVLRAYKCIPYALFSNEYTGKTDELMHELNDIYELYHIYKKGMSFLTEGTNGDYIPSKVRYKKIATLINKEARFMFGQYPDFNVLSQADRSLQTEATRNNIDAMQTLVNTVLTENNFESMLMKAGKDCLIGKRVAFAVNFSEYDGVTIQAFTSKDFVFECKGNNTNALTKFVSFTIIEENTQNTQKRIFKKKYKLEVVNNKDVCFVEESIHDGNGVLISTVTEYQETLLDRIPVAIVLNDGLTGDIKGLSEIEQIGEDVERAYSKLSNADTDSLRKSMNPIKYTVDMSTETTKGLSTSAGAYWDLLSDQNIDRPNPSIGTLESNIGYSSALETTLKRMKSEMYEAIDMPDISPDTLAGMITSGKSLKAIYWGLTVRCNEKMKEWHPALQRLVSIIIDGAIIYSNTIAMYNIDVPYASQYKIEIVTNYPIQDDENEEKTIDLSEISNNAMSRLSYIKKWRKMTDKEAQEELLQIAKEQALFENATGSLNDTTQLDNINDSTQDNEDLEYNTEDAEDTEQQTTEDNLQQMNDSIQE